MVLAFWNPQSIKEQNNKHKLANFKVCQKVLRATGRGLGKVERGLTSNRAVSEVFALFYSERSS